MSTLLENPKYGPKPLEDQWINNIFSSHDLFCGCNDPILHLFDILNRKGPCRKPLIDIKNAKCLITGEETHFTEEDIAPGELEALFADDGGEEDAGPSTSG